MKCTSCCGEVSTAHRFCPHCAAPISSLSEMPTAMASSPAGSRANAAAPPLSVPVGRLASSDSIPVGGFTPGMVLAERYRIIGLLGRGGMGEVYRADDLKLGQPMALKFLPNSLADDPVRRERFFAEVRIARQVSHPNICRVYDIAEIDGRHFLTMEYIDGEDLASLLKRIGHLHGDKALDLARQMCSGMAAAHDKGVLHRDLKPANVMIDGRGRVRITDFGLAVAAGEELPAGEVSGTPAYMAPEQFAGKGASVRSDIYALGLVLYELYTGKRAFEARTLAELRSIKETSSATAPSEIVREMDPVVERVILRCLAKDPRQRPASAAQVAAALPGGDPLAAAIAAGETPSPEMVAAAGTTEGLKPWLAWTCLALVIFGMGVSVVLTQNDSLHKRVQMDKPPEVLTERAREIVGRAGYSEGPADSAFGFEPDADFFRYVREHYQSASRWDRLPDSVIQFWLRQSPRPLEHVSYFGVVTRTDPPLIFSGESSVSLDARGRLIDFRVIPPEKDPSPGTAPTADFTPLFQEAGLDPAKWASVEPAWTPPSYADVRAAWTGVLPDRPEVPMRIEAAAYRGKPVFWTLISPWTLPSRMAPPGSSPGQNAASIILAGLLIAVTLGTMLFARRNLHMGRGDKRGAARLAYFFFILSAVVWLFGEHHVATLGELSLLVMFLSWALLSAGFIWLLYIALEPFVRRRWPNALVGWSRLLAGSFRDPLVGRDLVLGCTGAAVIALVLSVERHVASWAGVPQGPPITSNLVLFKGAGATIGTVASEVGAALFFALGLLFLFFLLRLLLRRDWAAAALFVLLWTAIGIFSPESGFSSGSLLLSVGTAGIFYGGGLFVLLRFGLLAFAAEYVFIDLLTSFPITTQLSAWYSGIGIAGVMLLLGLAGYGFYTSLGGQPLFQSKLLED